MKSYDEIMGLVEGIRADLSQWAPLVGLTVPYRCVTVSALERIVRLVAQTVVSRDAQAAGASMRRATSAVRRGDNAEVWDCLERAAGQLAAVRAEREAAAGRVPSSG